MAEWEKRIRAKCKVGDIIAIEPGYMRGRLCNLSGLLDGKLCLLAAVRKTY